MESNNPQYGERSPDGHYWWDGQNWQQLQQGESEGGESQGDESQGGQSQGDESGGQHPVLAKVNDPSELQDHFVNAMDASQGQPIELEG
jgi:hypothetical protein